MRLRFHAKFALALTISAIVLSVAHTSPRRTATVRSSKACCSAAASLPATPLGSVTFGGGSVNVILNSDTAYACGSSNIGVIDISNPSAPRLLSSFAGSDLGGNAIVGCFQVGQSLVVPVNTQSGFVYDISDRRNLKSQARFTPAFPFSGFVSFLGNTGWFTTDSFTYTPGPNTISTQSGYFFSVDFTDPTHPAALGNLSSDPSQPASSTASPRFGSMTIAGDTAYVLSTTSTGPDTNGGQGAFQIVNISNPSAPVAQGQIIIPQATTLTSVSPVQNNIVLVTGNTKSWRNPGVNPRNPGNLNFQFTGVLTLSAFDVSDPHNPALVSTRCTDIAASFGYSMAPLGGGFFALAVGPPADDAVAFGADPRGQLLLVDARDPGNLGLFSMGFVAKLSGLAVNGGTLYAATGDGLSTFQLPDLGGL
jgi:hypothetical protein